MADNEKVVSSNNEPKEGTKRRRAFIDEKVKEKEAEYNDASNAFEKGIRIKEENIRVNIREGAAKKGISILMQSFKERVDKLLEDPVKKFDTFKKRFGINKASVEELTEKEKADFDSFEYTEEEKNELCADIYSEAKEAIRHVNTSRYAELKKLGERIDKLREGTKQLIDQKTKDMEGLPKDSKEYYDLQKQIERLQKIEKGIGERGSKGDSLTGKISSAFSTQELVREDSFNQMAGVFGEKMVSEDRNFIMGSTLGGKVQEAISENVKGDSLENTPPKTLENQGKNNEAPQEKANNQARVNNSEQQNVENPVNNQSINPENSNVAPESKDQNAEQEKTEEEKPFDRFESKFGKYDANNLKYEGAWDVLAAFSSKTMTDASRLEMLRNPKYKALVMQACNVASCSAHPIRGFRYRDAKKRMLQLTKKNGKNTLLQSALKEFGIEDEKNIKKTDEGIKEADRLYSEKRKEIDKVLNDSSLSDEEHYKAKILSEELDARYKNISNVNELGDLAKGLKFGPNKIKNFTLSIFKPSTYKELGAEMSSRIFLDEKEEELLNKEREEFIDRNRSYTTSDKARVNSEISRQDLYMAMIIGSVAFGGPGGHHHHGPNGHDAPPPPDMGGPGGDR